MANTMHRARVSRLAALRRFREDRVGMSLGAAISLWIASPAMTGLGVICDDDWHSPVLERFFATASCAFRGREVFGAAKGALTA